MPLPQVILDAMGGNVQMPDLGQPPVDQTPQDVSEQEMEAAQMHNMGASEATRKLLLPAFQEAAMHKLTPFIGAHLDKSNDYDQRLNAIQQEVAALTPADPMRALMDRMKQLTGATNIDDYQKQAFEKRYVNGTGKGGAALRLLTDVLRSATGHQTLQDSVKGEATKDFKDMLTQVGQSMQEEKLNRQQIAQAKAQQLQYDRLGNQRDLDTYRNQTKDNALQIQRQYQDINSKIKAYDVANKGSEAALRDSLVWFKERFGGNADQQTFTALTDSFRAAGASDADAKLRARAILAAMKTVGQRPIRTGTTTTESLTQDPVTGKVTSGSRTSEGSFASPGGSFLQDILKGTGKNQTLSPALQQILTPPSVGGPSGVRGIAPPTPAGVLPEEAPLNWVGKTASADKAHFDQMKSSADQQQDLLRKIVSAGVSPNPRDGGRPEAANFTGVFNGNGVSSMLRSAFGIQSPTELESKMNFILNPFSTAKGAVGGRITQQEISTVAAGKPAPWQKYENLVGLAAANAINADIEKWRAAGRLPSVTDAGTRKITGEIKRIQDVMRTATNNYDLSKPLSAATITKIQGQLDVRNVLQILREPEYKSPAQPSSTSTGKPIYRVGK